MKRYVIAGAGQRALGMYARPIVERYQDSAELAGIYDPNPVRRHYVAQACGGVPEFAEFDKMIEEARPDRLIVTTVDRYHHDYILRGLHAGCDVITEKPMTVDDEKVRAILAAERATGRQVIVTFNYRYSPYVTRTKEILRSGAIGQVLSVHFEWILDTSHGADYFRRWHRRLENSGGLFVHKATHHFDMVNWWIEDEPAIVFANGERRFYGPTRAERGERCSTCEYKRTCEFYVDYAANPLLQALYFAAEHEDGYYRDRCVFADEIDIYDTMSATVRYKSGIMMSYSLVAHAPYEGWHIALNGTEGRLEAEEYHSGHHVDDTPIIRVFNRKGEIVGYERPKAQGDHGGGDSRLQDRLFGAQQLPDPLNHFAGSRAGAMSVLIGVAANHSVATGKPIAIDDLLAE